MISSSGENLVFIFSLPRSGSTLLSLLLGSHPQVYSPPEPWFLLKLFNITNRSDFNSIYDDELATKGTKEFLDYESLNRAINAFAIDVYNHKLSKTGKQIFVDKTPRYYHILSEIDSTFPLAKKIWLRRNPLDIAWSYKDTWGLGSEVISGDSFLSHSLDFSIGLFSLCDYFEKTSVTKTSIKYEDLVASPDETIRTLCSFIGIEYDPLMVRFSSSNNLLDEHRAAMMGDTKIHATDFIHNSSVGKGFETFANSEIEKIVQTLGVDILKRYGYPELVDELKRRRIRLVSEETAYHNRQALMAKNVDTVTRLKNELEKCYDECNRCMQSLEELKSSLSFRITKPLRWLGDRFRKK